ncbi:MAG: ComF family protein [Patescibacteria group bacterium]|nr:ComF family protein [Patescibacteria group bacterium]
MNTKEEIINYARIARNFLLDLLFPLECLGCGKSNEWLCQDCFRSLPINNRQFCPACFKKNKNSNYCEKCAPNYFLDGVWVASDYNNKIVSDLIKKYKYHFIKDLNTVLGRLLIIYFTQLSNSYNLNLNSLKEQLKIPLPILWPDNTIVMSVPLHKRRYRWRGFNQAELIAADFCDYFKFNLKSNSLIRTKYTSSQAKLNQKKRLKNILGVFLYKGDNLLKRPIILIDDVVTTGSTLNECAKVLKQNGASEVWGLVLAQG